MAGSSLLYGDEDRHPTRMPARSFQERLYASWLIGITPPQAQRQRLAKTDSTTEQTLPPAAVRWITWLSSMERSGRKLGELAVEHSDEVRRARPAGGWIAGEVKAQHRQVVRGPMMKHLRDLVDGLHEVVGLAGSFRGALEGTVAREHQSHVQCVEGGFEDGGWRRVHRDETNTAQLTDSQKRPDDFTAATA